MVSRWAASAARRTHTQKQNVEPVGRDAGVVSAMQTVEAHTVGRERVGTLYEHSSSTTRPSKLSRVGHGGPRMKEYLQCAQRAGLSGGSDARSIASRCPVALAGSLCILP